MRYGRDDERSPESPPPYDSYQGRCLYTSRTKIRIETDEESFQYSLDRSGYETGSGRQDNRGDFEDVGGFSNSPGSSIRRDRIHETGRDTGRDKGGFWSHEDRPRSRGITISHESHSSRQSTQENSYRDRSNSNSSRDGRPLYDLVSIYTCCYWKSSYYLFHNLIKLIGVWHLWYWDVISHGCRLWR